tara:strand:+ start:777 stop:1157 length:381 start_codon:yes stop_codon:yes gene_type:complete
MGLVECTYDYWGFVLEVRNLTSKAFFVKSHITKAEHFDFMLKNYQTYRICIDDEGTPMGFVAHVDNDIRIATHPKFQKRGVAKFMLTEFMAEFPEAVAKVKHDNIASLNLFESCGFQVDYYGLKKC